MKHKKYKQDVINLLQSGNFTIAYHDNGYCSIYEGVFDKYDDLHKSKERFAVVDSDSDGYTPAIVTFLAEALKGKSLSI